MTDWPKISIVTPSFNQGKFLEKTILSVLEQDYPNLEYIIVDGGSTDNSVEIIKKYEQQLAYWVSEPDRGQSHAINKGFEKATGEIFGWLNSDDLYCIGALHKVAKVNWRKADLCYGEGIWIDAQGLRIGRYPTIKPCKMTLFYKCTLCQPSVFFKRETFYQLGPFSTSHANSFDYEYWLRADSAGKKFTYLPKTLAFSRMHLDNKTLSEQEVVQYDNSKIFCKYFPDGNPDGMSSDQYRVITEEYTRYREYWLHRWLNNNYSDLFWKKRNCNGLIDKKAVCLIRTEKIHYFCFVFEVIDHMLPVTVNVSSSNATRLLIFSKPGTFTIPLSSLVICDYSKEKIKVVLNSDKLSVKINAVPG